MEELKYRDLFLTIVLKDLRENRRELASLIISETILISLFTAGAVGFQIFASQNTDEYFMREDGISRMFVSGFSLMLLCGVVLLIATLIPYLGKRVPKYILFKRMGASVKDRRRMVIIEGGVTYLCSIIPGLLLGILFSSILRRLLISYLNINFELGKISLFTYPIICIVALLAYVLSFLLTGELESDFRVITSMHESARIEKLSSRLPVLQIVSGLVMCVAAYAAYTRIAYHEALYLATLFYIGLYLIGRNAASMLMTYTRKNNPEKYYRNLLINDQFYNRFRTTTRYILAFSLISFLACFSSGFQIIGIVNAQQPDELFPYDIMCLADENDTKYFDGLKKDSDIEIHEYPMVRVTNLDKTERFERISEITIQGQQIGISESTYHELKKAIDPSYVSKDLGLKDDGSNVYVVHQQDRSIKAQPVDWRYNKSKPDLHIGVPCIRVLDEYHGTYCEKDIAGEEIASITGCYSTPKCENIIVFSDRYFEKAQDEWMNVDVATGYSVEAFMAFMGDDAEPLLVQGPTKLVLINTDEFHVKELDKELDTMEKDHQYIGNYDSSVHFHYSSENAIKQMVVERAARISINISIMTIFLLVGILLLYSKCQMELKEKKGRDKFLRSMGMPVKERIRILKREISVFVVYPAIILIVSSVVFVAGTYRVRMYNSELAASCTRMYATLFAGWIIVNVLCTWLVAVTIRKEIMSNGQ